jgi:serine/threonine-protein kinase
VTLERVVMEALAKDPAKRFPTANDLLRALDQALPSSMRASTDDEVATFLRSLFSEQRERHKTALNAAMARADTLAQEGAEGGRKPGERKLRELLDSQPPPSAVSQSAVSGIATLTGSETPLGTTSPSASSAMIQAEAFAEIPKRRSVWPKLVALVLVLAGAGAALYVARSRLPFLNPPPSPPPATETAPALAETTPMPPPSPSPSPSAVAPPPAAATESAPEVEPEPSASAPAASASARVPSRSTAPVRPMRPTAPVKPGAPTWKQDPGF